MIGICVALMFGAVPPSAPSAPATPSEPPLDLVWMVGSPVPDPLPAKPVVTKRLMTKGRALYRSACAACHGADGRGDGDLAPRLKVPPTNFAAAVFKLRSTPSGTLPTDADLFRTITRGLHGTPMLPATRLGPEDRWALVFHIESLSPRFRAEPRGDAFATPPPPQDSEDLRRRGRSLYRNLRCHICHGPAGAANGPAVQVYGNSASERHVRIRDFTRGRFIRGAEIEDIYLTLRTGLDGTPMGSYDSLMTDELWALAAYVRDLVRERPLGDLPPAGDAPRAPRP